MTKSKPGKIFYTMGVNEIMLIGDITTLIGEGPTHFGAKEEGSLNGSYLRWFGEGNVNTSPEVTLDLDDKILEFTGELFSRKQRLQIFGICDDAEWKCKYVRKKLVDMDTWEDEDKS